MSSFDQAFVKAFARRNRSAGNRSVGNRVVANPETAKQVVSVPRINPVDEPGSLKLDRSVANSAEIWIDPIEDQIARQTVPTRMCPSRTWTQSAVR